MKKLRLMSILLCAAVLLPAFLVPASANSAQNSWSGVSSSGAICQEEESPLEVKKEVLTFDLPTYPSPYDDSEEDLRAYDSTFTAEYTFYNPSDYTITAQLLFPMGDWPEYFIRPEELTGDSIYDDLEKFNVTVDGVSVEKEIRHSLYFSEFDLEPQLAQLQDDYRTDTFMTPETPVTHYRFRYSGSIEDEMRGAGIRFPLAEPGDFLVYYEEKDAIALDDDGFYCPSYRATDNSGTVNVYTIGETPESLFQWELVNDSGDPVEGEVTLEKTETFSLEEMMLRNWTEDSGISKVDWYNSGIQWLLEESSHTMCPGLIDIWHFGPMEGYLMCWYAYEITLEPGQELVNTVTAPAFPDISYPGSGSVYDYTYLLSPAKTWSKFGTLDIRINSSKYLLRSDLKWWESDDYRSEALEDWEEDASGYSLHLDGLPEGELVFALSDSLDPYAGGGKYGEIDDSGLASQRQSSSLWIDWVPIETFLIVIIQILVNLLALPVMVIVVLVHLVRKKKKNKRP